MPAIVLYSNSVVSQIDEAESQPQNKITDR